MSPAAASVRHYLEISFAGGTYLMPNLPQLVVEPRENLAVRRLGMAAAQRVVQGVTWPAFALNAELEPVAEAPWTRGIFLNPAGRGVGILVDDMRLVAVDRLRIEAFSPLGPLPPGGQPLFDAASMQGEGLSLVFSVGGLVAHLLYQEHRHGRAD
ncbi:MAG: hypothetical protein M0Z76_10435 [Gammaproteobacteria bacterium]|nr:hypothetical protein [Gammaproteobacteria bacterium]